VDLNHIETFLAVLDSGSFSQAAQKLNRTQPAISLSIKRLEEEIGQVLFARSSKGGNLTEAGKTLYSYARKMINLREEALASIRELQGLIKGKLSLGANESTCQYLLPTLLRSFHNEYPSIKIEVYRNVSEKIPSEILERNLDFGFLSYAPTDPRLISKVILKDSMVMVVAKNHQLLQKKIIFVRDLGEYKFLAHNARTPSRTKVMDAFAQAGTPLNISMELDSLSTIIDFVAEGLGVAILPGISVAKAIKEGRLVRVEVEDMTIERSLRIVHRKEHSSAGKAFLEMVLAKAAKI